MYAGLYEQFYKVGQIKILCCNSDSSLKRNTYYYLQFEADTRITLEIPIEEIVEAFTKMKSRNPSLYRASQKKYLNTEPDEIEDDTETDSE